jgi:hypothetical protein
LGGRRSDVMGAQRPPAAELLSEYCESMRLRDIHSQ